MSTGLDYSAGTIPGATIRRAGHDFVIRYVDDPRFGVRTKHVRPDEYADLVAAGLDVWLVFEIGTGDMLGGYTAGATNARRALAGADWIGYPAHLPIFMASDMHLTASQVRAALAYIDGAVSVLGWARTGVYGFTELIVAAQGRAAAFWQCGRDPGPAGAAHIWQRNDGFTWVGGIQCDINVLYRPFAAAAAPVQPKVKPVIQNFPVVGAGVLELNTMIKGASAFYGSAFLSARSTQSGHVNAWWGMSGQGGRGEAHWDLTPNGRRWTELTGGDVDQTTVHYDMGTWTDAHGEHPADGVISVEFGPK